jgi:hypothetical protein
MDLNEDTDGEDSDGEGDDSDKENEVLIEAQYSEKGKQVLQYVWTKIQIEDCKVHG